MSLIKVHVTEDARQWAEIEGAKIGKRKNSILEGKGNVAGKIGEWAAQRVFGGMLDGNHHDWDLTLPESWTATGRKADVKTKQCSFAPLPQFACHVAKANDDQFCHLYIFVRVNYARTLAWICGWMSKEEFKEKRVLCIVGDDDPTGAKKFEYKATCWGVTISACHQLDDLKIDPANSQKYAAKYVPKPPAQRELL